MRPPLTSVSHLAIYTADMAADGSVLHARSGRSETRRSRRRQGRALLFQSDPVRGSAAAAGQGRRSQEPHGSHGLQHHRREGDEALSRGARHQGAGRHPQGFRRQPVVRRQRSGGQHSCNSCSRRRIRSRSPTIRWRRHHPFRLHRPRPGHGEHVLPRRAGFPALLGGRHGRQGAMDFRSSCPTAPTGWNTWW